MPRTMQEILDNADELAKRFETYEPDDDDRRDAQPLRELRDAVLARGQADHAIMAAVTSARAANHSWAAIGAMLGTSGEAARQKFATVAAAR